MDDDEGGETAGVDPSQYDPGQIQTPSVPNSAAGAKAMANNLSGVSGTSSSSGSSRSTSHDIHPHLRQYDSVVHVVGEEDDE